MRTYENSPSTMMYAKLVRDTFSMRYEHATVHWYTLSSDKVVPNFVLFYTFDIVIRPLATAGHVINRIRYYKFCH